MRPEPRRHASPIELTSGTLEYADTGDGPVVVLLHGLLMDGSLWDDVVADLAADHRCVVPTLPMGAHRHALGPEADLSLDGLARLVLELLVRLDLRDVTLVGNDTGGAIAQLVVAEDPTRIGRLVLASCEAFDNFPARVTGTALVRIGRLSPRLFGLFMQQMRLRPVRRLPIAFGWLTKRGDAATRRWLAPILGDAAIRRDTVRLLRTIARQQPLLAEAGSALSRFDRPALVVWARADRVMPPEHGRRLAELLPAGELIEVDDSYSLVALDQPTAFAAAIRRLMLDRR